MTAQSATCRQDTWSHASNGIDKVVVYGRFSLTDYFPADRRWCRWR